MSARISISMPRSSGHPAGLILGGELGSLTGHAGTWRPAVRSIFRFMAAAIRRVGGGAVHEPWKEGPALNMVAELPTGR